MISPESTPIGTEAVCLCEHGLSSHPAKFGSGYDRHPVLIGKCVALGCGCREFRDRTA